MKNKIIRKNPRNLLNKNKARALLLKFGRPLGLSKKLEVQDIQRFLTWREETYVLLYTITNEDNLRLIRGNASTKNSRLASFRIIKTLKKRSFTKGSFRIPSPSIFIKDYNLILYNNIEGETLIDEFKSNPDIEILKKKIGLCAQWLVKFHTSGCFLKLPKYDIKFFKTALAKYYPQLARNLEKIKKNNLAKIRYHQPILIHGDFQPNNIIIRADKIWVYDFNDAALDNPMLDVASFLAQLRVMLFRFSKEDYYYSLEKIFLEEYQKSLPINPLMAEDLKIYQHLYYLKILTWFCGILLEGDPEIKTLIPQVYQYWQE